MRFMKNFFLILCLLSLLCVGGLIIHQQILKPKNCLSEQVNVHHPDYVSCGPIVEQDLLAKAQNNDIQAAFKLALMYDIGDRVPENRERAIYWLQKAEQANLADAQYVMAVWAERGYFAEASADLVIPMYEAAARQGHLNAMKSLANIFYETNEKKYQFWMNKIRTYQ